MKDPVALAFILFLTGCWAFPDLDTTAASPLPDDPTASAEFAALSEEYTDVVNRLANLRKEFLTSEQRILSYIYSAKNITRKMSSNAHGFLDEMHVYLNELPNSAQQKRTRARCHCEGRFRSPCPEWCMNSCYAYNCGSYDDCAQASECQYSTARCHEGSTTEVLNQDASVCFDPLEPARCSEFNIDRSNMEQSYRQFSNLLAEPFKMQIRELEYKLEFIKESLYTTSALSNITFQLCNESKNVICFAEATKVFNDKLEYFIEFEKNITRELINGQDQMERVEHNLHVLREGTLKQITETIKMYTCCLEGIDFQVEGVECSPVFKGIPELEDITSKTTTPQLLDDFQSDSDETIPSNQVCDGEDDCTD